MREVFTVDYRGFRIVAYYQDNKPSAKVVITRLGRKYKEFEYPAYRVFNLQAHFSDYVEDELRALTCIVCGKTCRTRDSLILHQKATYHRIKDCECHCHCLDRALDSNIKKPCNCEMLEMTVECNHCKGRYTQEERDLWFKRHHKH